MSFGVAKGRLVTQSCSLLSMAHTLTHHAWNTHHDQHAAGGSQNKLLTIVSLWSDMGHATTVRWVGWSRMSSKVIQHAETLKLPQYLCEEFHQIPEACTGKPSVSARISAAKKGHELFSAGYDKIDMHCSTIYLLYKMIEKKIVCVQHLGSHSILVVSAITRQLKW